ncbi:MAG: MotA/TolQ/ExbB proton channel family protein [Planctomycetes bacterium]|nr:MotA/TolQ/ExbB proton channel family protein [Planctomycetota bacterium]MBL7009264.1 MotA/TolQ/ExbB proton channel family protein [Planctomycetota bacterium]
MTPLLLVQPDQEGGAAGIGSLFDMIANGGPVMWPLGLCSVLAVAFMVERGMRLRRGALGGRESGRQVIDAYDDGGAPGALELCDSQRTPMSRILAAGLKRLDQPLLEMEKAVEDAGARELRVLSAKLRPLVVIAAIAPLLGLLGTVWGMIQAFTQIAMADALGRPERLAEGISSALITTAVGLSIAIPSQAAYYFFRSRLDRFVTAVEETYGEIADRLLRGGGA